MPTIQPFAVVERIQETPQIFSLRLRPTTGKIFSYAPGQFVMLHLRNHDDPFVSSRARPFSLASLPRDDALIVTAKVHGPFTQALNALDEGSLIEVSGPFGLFTLPETIAGPIVFLAAGVGAAPLRSMIATLGMFHPRVSAALILSVPSLEEYLYRSVWESFLHRFPTFRLVTTLTNNAPGDWQGERGRITATMINSATHNLSEPIFFVCGPPLFVDDMHAILTELGVTDARIKKERYITLGPPSSQ